MSVTFREVIAGAQFRADLSVSGVGPHSSERVTDAEWRALVNDAVKFAWRIAAGARPDFQFTSQDVTLVSGASASFTVPSNFFGLLDVVYGPDTAAEYSLGPFAWQNRRSPGTWLPPFVSGGQGGNSARLMGSSVFIEPATRAGGIYRLWYTPAPKLIRADFTVAWATTAALPGCTASGSGVGKTLVALVNGALTVDGNAVSAGDLILVQNEASAANNGIYVVVNTGSAGSTWALIRSVSFDQAAEVPLGLMVYVAGGATNIDVFFELTSTVVTVDVTAQNWAEAFIDPILEQWAEMLKVKAAMPAIDRDDDLSLTTLTATLGTLASQMSEYFRGTRVAPAPGRPIDTDQLGPRSWWSW